MNLTNPNFHVDLDGLAILEAEVEPWLVTLTRFAFLFKLFSLIEPFEVVLQRDVQIKTV